VKLHRTRSLPWEFDDGGRAAAGYRGRADDCVTRAIAIGAGLPYQQVYDLVNEAGRQERPSRSGRGARSTARTGVLKPTTRRILADLGWDWTPTMQIGSGTTVHLAKGELPDVPVLIVKASKHIVAVVGGVVRDTHDPTRDGTRAVYGYWTPPAAKG
jgi:hypothetical protein